MKYLLLLLVPSLCFAETDLLKELNSVLEIQKRLTPYTQVDETEVNRMQVEYVRKIERQGYVCGKAPARIVICRCPQNIERVRLKGC
jgi:hypothetical protein